MTITLAGGGSPTALSTQKRRYSSTAVGFPIRFDLRGYSQRVSRVFPSWVGARCACTYVYAHGIDFELSEERQPQCSLSTCNLPASTTSTPIRRPQFSYLLVPSPLPSRCVILASSSPAGWLLRVKAIPAAVVVLVYYPGRPLVHLCINRTCYLGSLVGHSWFT